MSLVGKQQQQHSVGTKFDIMKVWSTRGPRGDFYNWNAAVLFVEGTGWILTLGHTFLIVGRKPRKNMQTPCRKALPTCQLNPAPSCCEAAVLTTRPPRHHQQNELEFEAKRARIWAVAPSAETSLKDVKDSACPPQVSKRNSTVWGQRSISWKSDQRVHEVTPLIGMHHR